MGRDTAGQTKAEGALKPGAFDGVTVLSLAEQYPGPYATLLLADLGADVILIERPQGGDPARAFPAFFAALARNKRSVALDLKTDAGREAFLSLAAKADVVLEGFRPGTAERLDIGYEVLKRINPQLIYAQISGFGQFGPYRDRLGHDLSYQAVAGLLFERAETGGLPPMISFGDLAGGMFAAFSIASALFARARTGLGTSIDISMTDGLVSWMTSYLSPAAAGAASLPVHEVPSYGFFSAACGNILTLSIAHEDHFWRALCAVLPLEHGMEALDSEARLANSDALRARIAGRISARPLVHWAELFDKHGVPWSPLHDLQAVLSDPHFRARGLFTTIDTTDGESRELHVLQPVRFSNFASALKRPAPKLGEHNVEIIGPA